MGHKFNEFDFESTPLSYFSLVSDIRRLKYLNF